MGRLKGIGAGSGQPLVAVEFFNEGADQGFAIQADFMFGFDLGEDFRDMEGFMGLVEYV